MSDTLRQRKAEIRRRIGELARSLDPAQRDADSARLRARLLDQPVWRQARSVLFYAARHDEPDLMPLLEKALAGGKIVALPRYRKHDNCYEICRIHDPRTDLRVGHYRILEPVLECPALSLESVELLLVPGVAFSLRGERLGRGKGYYDMLLAQTRGVRCGVAFDWQVCEQLPAGPHDQRLNYLVTPTRWIRCETE